MTADPVASLARSLRGPRRVKRRMLREASEGLTDAVEAHRAVGLDDDAARARAVAEFGPVPAVRPAFQDELDRALARRAATVGLCLFPLVTLFWNVAWECSPYPTWPAPSAQFVVAFAASLPALAASLAAAVALAATYRLRPRGTWQLLYRRAHTATVLGTAAFCVAVSTLPATNPKALLWPPTTLTTLTAAVLALLAVTACRSSARRAGC